MLASNRRFPAGAMLFSDHHAHVLTLKGASYGLRGRGTDSHPGIKIRIRQTNETTIR